MRPPDFLRTHLPRLRVHRALAVAGLAACVAVAGLTSRGDVVIYGIDDAARIVQVTLDEVGGGYTGNFAVVESTGMAGQQNAFAYDTSRDQMFFISAPSPGDSFSGRSVYAWDRSNPVTQVATAAEATIGRSSIPANASYYANAFWFFDESDTDELVRVNFSYATGQPSFASTARHQIAGYSGATAYGDIAIDATTGRLYGAATNGLFFRLDLSGSTPSGYTAIKAASTGNPSLQIAFSPDYATLFGQDYATGKWYSIDRSTGNLTDIGVTAPASYRLRDLGGSSTTIAPVPEPSAATLGVVGVAFAVAVWRRRRAG